ncbi:hypothetical protein [Arenicella chitinivorans]|uniref:hypothetical protein n=1 Tax=Arenicella chitinivorans TaxID=1329800 RepID=UPI001674E5B5|nr:hypothetical protein [Arenicella chitinivorans]
MIIVTSISPRTRALQPTAYTLAGQTVVFDQAVTALSEYASPAYVPKQSEYPALQPELAATVDEVYRGPAPIDGRLREVTVWQTAVGVQIDVDAQPVCQLDIDQAAIHLLCSDGLGSRVNLEVITGPALILLLQRRSIYCLHAGAVHSRAGVIAMVAESGAGKSTLSAHDAEDWRQVSDDLLPVRLSGDGDSSEVSLLPDYPQLKLPNARVAWLPSQAFALDYLVRINPQPAEVFECRRLPLQSAMLQLIRHTVAAKLFDASSLAAHAEFAKRFCQCVPAFEIAYPRALDQLPDLRQQLVDALLTT